MLWLRFHTRIVDDHKLQTLPDRPINLFRFWANCLCLAKELDQGGALPPIPILCFRLRLSERVVSDALRVLTTDPHKLIDVTDDGFIMHDWEEWQRDGDNAKDRAKRYRDRKRSDRVTSLVTSRTRHAFGSRDALEESKSRVEQNRAEQRDVSSPFSDFAERLYAAHPNRRDRGLAIQYLSEIEGIDSPEVQAAIEAGHALWRNTPEWQKNNGSFAPRLCQWILDKGWLYPPISTLAPPETPVDAYIRKVLSAGGAQ